MPRTVVVTDAETAAGVTVIRSLGRAGWRVVAASSKRSAPGVWSKFADERYVMPAFDTDAARAANALISISQRTGAELVIPVTDKATIALSARRDELGSAQLAAAPPDALDLARDKSRSTQLAATLGIPTPRSEQVDDPATARRVAGEIGYPLVVKPLRSHEHVSDRRIETRAVTYAFDPVELERHFATDGFDREPLLLQEYVPGDGVGVELLMRSGEPVVAFQHRRLRQVPVTGGMSASRISEPVDAILLDHSVRLLEALDWSGLAMVEFRVGPQGPFFLEINGRIWGSIALPVRAGLDFPVLLADEFSGNGDIGRSPGRGDRAAASYGVECRNLELELRWITGAIAARSSPILRTPPSASEIRRVGLGLLDPRNEFDVQVLDDPIPSTIDAMTALTRVAGETVSRVLQRLSDLR